MQSCLTLSFFPALQTTLEFHRVVLPIPALQLAQKLVRTVWAQTVSQDCAILISSSCIPILLSFGKLRRFFFQWLLLRTLSSPEKFLISQLDALPSYPLENCIYWPSSSLTPCLAFLSKIMQFFLSVGFSPQVTLLSQIAKICLLVISMQFFLIVLRSLTSWPKLCSM